MTTKIEWVQSPDGTKGETWNPVTGCSPVSAGCKNCYAERMAKRLAGRFGYPADDPFKVTFHPEKLNQPLHWRKPRRVFVCSMGDLFHSDVEWNWQYKIFEIMFDNPNHTYIILTKRPQNISKDLDNLYFHLGRNYGLIKGETDGYPFPLENVWFGVTAENQHCANERIPVLLQIPAAVRFVSVEPCLERINLQKYLEAGLDWVIIGAESGPKRRPCELDWVRDLVEQCKATDVPVFVKQLDIDGKVSHNMAEWPEWARVREYPKGELWI